MKRATDSRSPDETSTEKKNKPGNMPNTLSMDNMTSPPVGNNLELQTVEVVDAQNNITGHILQDEDGASGEASLGILVEFMDITEPLNSLRTLLELRTGLLLTDYHFYLQDTQELEGSKNLVNQCVQGEGLVQINVVISDTGGVKKINIVDVLKPAEEIGTPESNGNVASRVVFTGDTPYSESTDVQQKEKVPTPSEDPQQVTRWIIAPQFRKLQEKFKIPNDPCYWTKEFVRIWLGWAIVHFKIPNVDLSDWDLTGKDLVSVSQDVFKRKILVDPGELFWTHLELLRKFKIVAVIQQSGNPLETEEEKKKTKVQRIGPSKYPYEGSPGNNGQIQLWQFLLELLTDKDFRSFIQWVGNEGEFKLIHPEMVAQLWGQRKNKPTMNYEKLSRALRYYYDGDMLAKVHGKRFVYKFVCDLKGLLGYDAFELNRLVTECERKKNASSQSSAEVVFQVVDSNST